MDPSTLPSTRRSSLPEISPFTFIFVGNHELESVLLTPAPPLGTFGALEGSTAGREGEFGGVDCDSPFRHICPPLDRAWPHCLETDFFRIEGEAFGVLSG